MRWVGSLSCDGRVGFQLGWVLMMKMVIGDDCDVDFVALVGLNGI